MSRHKTKYRVILDHRNRELAYLWPDESAAERIRQLRKQGKRPARIIFKEK